MVFNVCYIDGLPQHLGNLEQLPTINTVLRWFVYVVIGDILVNEKELRKR